MQMPHFSSRPLHFDFDQSEHCYSIQSEGAHVVESFAASFEIRLSHQSNSRIIGGLKTVVAKTTVANELETFSSHFVALLFALVPFLQNGFEKVSRIVAKAVDHQVGNFKIVKLSLDHQPAKVIGGDCFFGMKGA